MAFKQQVKIFAENLIFNLINKNSRYEYFNCKSSIGVYSWFCHIVGGEQRGITYSQKPSRSNVFRRALTSAPTVLVL